MKKFVYLSLATLSLAACSSEDIVNDSSSTAAKDGPISFVMSKKNITRSYTDLQKADHYNFGVFAYKSTDKVNPVMDNYLVGYYDEAKAYQKAGTTWGDADGIADGLSYWMYEGMGNAEYNGTYAGGPLKAEYTSNKANQYLKYWDKGAEATYFYAYAPYINSSVKATATYVDGTAQAATGNDTYVLTIPNGTLKDGYDDPSLAEYMYASTKVVKANYGHDVALHFYRLNAKVNIKFWEDVPGYKVRILDLSDAAKGVQAAASIKEAGQGNYGYRAGKYYTENGVRIQFADGVENGMKQFEGTLADNTTTLKFVSPSDAKIGETRYTAAVSPTTYYAIPKGDGVNVLPNTSLDMSSDQACDADLAKTGFTFHVSYELTAEDTGERIVVKNATVHVPFDYCNWKNNTHYTYIFKITKNSNGSTDPTDDPTIDPTDPEVPTVTALYPIVFDNCTVEDWEENVSEWEITEGTNAAYHNITLTEGGAGAYSFSSLTAHVLEVAIADADTHNSHSVDYTKVTVAGPQETTGWYDSSSKKINVPANAAAGVYTVTYTCPATGVHATHPSTWTQTFVIGDAYTITTHRDVIGTNSNKSEAKLNITGTKNGSPETLTYANLSIDYPLNANNKTSVTISGTDVVVKNDATPGVYKVVYTVDEDGAKVKVAEKEFEVVDYSLVLSHTVVFNKYGGNIVRGNQIADADHVYTCTTGTPSGNTIIVNNNTAEGNYTVTYTVFKGSADETVYTQTFEVRNTHKVTVNKSAIDRNVGTSNPGDVSTDYITVQTFNNDEGRSTDQSSKLSVVTRDAEGNETGTPAGFAITYSTGNYYKLTVKNDVPEGDYYVKFVQTVAGADKAEYVHFVVTK